jgi:uncharacterized protein
MSLPKKKVSGGKECANCGDNNVNTTFRACSRCRLSYYCGRECQVSHWKLHKLVCVVIEDRHPNEKTLPPQNNSKVMNLIGKCPVCLESISSLTSCTLPCNHTFHIGCVSDIRGHKSSSQACPLCRTDLPPGPEQSYFAGMAILGHIGKDIGSQNLSEETIRLQETMTKYLTFAAEEGHCKAQEVCGSNYYYGIGTEQNFKKAFEFNLKASIQGSPRALFMLAVQYGSGEGVDKNDKLSVEYLEKSAKKGYAEAQFGFALELIHVRKDKSHKNAYGWLMKAAVQGHAGAQVCVGKYHEDGKHVKLNKKKAYEWYMKAAEQGNADGQYHVGTLHFTDTGAFGNYSKAVEYAKLAVAQGHEGAKKFFKTIESANQVQVQGTADPKSMIDQFMPAALKGDAKAQGIVASYMEMDGKEEEAMMWYEKAAAQGDEMAATQLLCMKNDGSEKCEKAKQKLMNFMEKKANLGYNSPQERAHLLNNLETMRQSAETIKKAEEQLLNLLKTHFSKEVALQKLEEDEFGLARPHRLAVMKRIQLLPESEFKRESNNTTVVNDKAASE